MRELKLRRYLGDMTAEAVEAQYAEHRDSEFYSDEAESVTDEYVAFCIETIEAVRSSCPDPLIMHCQNGIRRRASKRCSSTIWARRTIAMCAR